MACSPTGPQARARRPAAHPPCALHQAQAFSAELPEGQLAEPRGREAGGTPGGLEDETERTYVRLRSVREVLADAYADWARVGMILVVL